MRTTVTLDDDLAAALKARAEQSGQPFKAVLESAVRLGLTAEAALRPARDYRLQPAALGSPRGDLDLTKALQIADGLEDADLVRRLELSK